MRQFLSMFLAGIALVVMGVTVAYSYGNDTMTWTFTNSTGYDTQVEFMTDAGQHVWPGDNRAWSVPAYSRRSETINCVAGQKICYGGWVTGNDNRYWGRGNNGEHPCTGCCAVCGEADPNITLEP